jgi:hypothetical protein
MRLLKSFLFQVIVLSLGFGLAFAQGEEGLKTLNQEPQVLDLKWVLGEVMNIDLENKVISVKYLDYEDSEEKNISILIGSDTTFENIKSLEEIRPQDYLSLDYVFTQDGKNVAKNISLDKPKTVEAEGQKEADGQLPEIGE